MVGSSNDQVSKVGDTVFFIDALVVELGEAVLGTEKELSADQACPAQGMRRETILYRKSCDVGEIFNIANDIPVDNLKGLLTANSLLSSVANHLLCSAQLLLVLQPHRLISVLLVHSLQPVHSVLEVEEGGAVALVLALPTLLANTITAFQLLAGHTGDPP